jgi:hypothetical protein
MSLLIVNDCVKFQAGEEVSGEIVSLTWQGRADVLTLRLDDSTQVVGVPIVHAVRTLLAAVDPARVKQGLYLRLIPRSRHELGRGQSIWEMDSGLKDLDSGMDLVPFTTAVQRQRQIRAAMSQHDAHLVQALAFTKETAGPALEAARADLREAFTVQALQFVGNVMFGADSLSGLSPRNLELFRRMMAMVQGRGVLKVLSLQAKEALYDSLPEVVEKANQAVADAHAGRLDDDNLKMFNHATTARGAHTAPAAIASNAPLTSRVQRYFHVTHVGAPHLPGPNVTFRDTPAWEGMPEDWISLDGVPGADIRWGCRDAISIAKASGKTVGFMFNGQKVVVTKDSVEDKVVRECWSALYGGAPPGEVPGREKPLTVKEISTSAWNGPSPEGILLEVEVGANIVDVCRDALAVSEARQSVVTFGFNGVSMTIDPRAKADADQIVRMYRLHRWHQPDAPGDIMKPSSPRP